MTPARHRMEKSDAGARLLCAMVAPGPNAQGGVASFVRVLADAKLFEAGQVRLLPSYSDGNKLDKLLVALAAIAKYLLLICRSQVPVLHVHVSSHGSFWRKAVFIWVAALCRRSIIFHLHGGGFRAFVESRHPVVRRIVIATIRRSTRLLCLSSSVADWLREIAPTVPVIWWPNPVAEDLFTTSQEFEQRKPSVLFLGAFLPAKGVSDLITAFSSFHATNPEACLQLAGSGPEKEVLEAQVEAGGLSDHVHFLGWIDGEQRAHWLRRARLLVLPSQLESQPMVLLEAMASGLPVISTNVGGIPDIVRDGEDGVLVAPRRPDQLALALESLWNDPDRCERITKSAWMRAKQRHSAGVVSAALLALYTELADLDVDG